MPVVNTSRASNKKPHLDVYLLAKRDRSAFGGIRCVILDGRVWYSTKDTCESWLKYNNMPAAIYKYSLKNECRKLYRSDYASFSDGEYSLWSEFDGGSKWVITERAMRILIAYSKFCNKDLYEKWFNNRIVPEANELLKQLGIANSVVVDETATITPVIPVETMKPVDSVKPITSDIPAPIATSITATSIDGWITLLEQAKVKIDFYDTIQSYICAMPNMSMDKVLKLVKQAVDFAAD